MDSAAEEKRPGDAASSALATKEAEPTEEAERHAHKQEREKHSESVGATERADGGMDAADGADLSSINSMMSTVMKATLNGGVDPSPSVPTKTPIKSPSGRNARKNQETKDDGSSLVCPLCGKNCQTQHQLTMHIRQHNSDTGATDHSCSICGKCLSSASSLDRHMLVHSGERPYKCSMCGQTFTTNGNMHRHMKIHDKDSAISVPTSPPSPVKRRRPSAVKRKSSHDEDGDRADEPSSKRVVEDGGTDEPTLSKGQEESLTCPICFKTLSSKYDLEVHMDTHPDSTLRCELCCLSFRTHRGLLRHNAGIHKQLPTDPSGKPFIQNNPSIPLGFNDLAFIDFSCRKFSHIAQVWCESNLRRCTSKFHRFVCETCDKAFPLRSALDLHKTTHEPSGDAQEATPSQSSSVKPHVPEEKNSFMDFLGLQHVSTVKPLPSEEEALQAELDSIRVIHVETPSSLQEAEMLGGVGLSLVDPTSLRGMSQNEALKLLSLQPFQTSFFVQPDGGMVVKPVCGESGVELADIQQILKVASAAPNHISLPPLSKAPCSALQSVYKQMPPLKPKPLVAPRTNMATSTPPPPLTTQQASLGCVSPSLPPPAGHLLKPAKELSPSTSSSSSSACKQASMERIQMEADCMGDAQTPMDVDEQQIKQEEDKVGETSGKKGTARKGSYPCRFCDQVFAYSGVLQAHMRYHLGILPHQCNICDYVAPDKATLIRHLRTHSGERPYVCRVCHYPFTVKANCERHLRKKHMKNTRKEIEKNIKYVTSSSSTLETAGSADTTCRFCGEDLKTYRALQIHRCTLNGFQRKPFECKRCGAAFLARRNCIHHLLKQHPEVKEQEIEQYIATPLSTPSQASPNSSPHNGVSPSASLRPVKVEDLSVYSGDLDQPLDFSNKSRGSSSSTGSSSGSPGIKIEAASYESSMEPIDLSIPKQVKKDTNGVIQKEVKKEQVSLKIADSSKGMQMEKATDEKPQHLGCYQLPVALTALTASNATGRPLRLKPLLPKPTSAGVKEMPPLASIAKIISSVSAAPDLLKRENSNSYLPISDTSSRQEVGNNSVEELPLEGSKVKSKKRLASNSAKEKPTMNLTDASVDLESSGEFASVERMLATTDTNKFSTYLQTNTIDLGRKEEEQLCDKRDSKDEKHLSAKQASHSQQSKGKKNAYSNSVQKMTCPFCPRVFPWASSLQRHMLTHTGQKPYPCPKCEALFSTKSNCERHLLRKHGITNRILRQNGVMPKVKDPEEASQESAESMSETELSVSEAMDITNSGPERAAASDAEKPSPAKPTEAASVNTLLHQGEQEHQQTPEPEEAMDTENDNDDALSSKSLDLNFANRLIEFKFSESDQPQSSPATECDTQERATPHDDSKFTCKSCNKSFRYPATLARHEKVHLLESAAEASNANPQANHVPEPCEPKKEEVDEETEKEEQKGAAESEGAGSAMDSASEEEKEGRSDEEGEATESKSCEGETVSSGNKSDKRKKICSVCSKRFWSLQDLTRHMRSHTGERPYKCQTCERTFTLKHSLVRHQRVHQKPRGSDGDSSTAPLTGRGGDEDGFSGRSASEGECTPTSTNPPSENENESEVTESIKASPCPESGETDSKSATAEPEASENGIEGEKIATTAAAEEVETDEAEPATQTSKEHLAEEQAADSPVASSTEAERPEGFLQGLLEIHSNPSSEHILPPSELPLVGVE